MTMAKVSTNVTSANLVNGAPLKEVVLIALGTLAAFLALALFSYDPSDPSWSYQGTGLETTNLVGSSGAWSADKLAGSLGEVVAGRGEGRTRGGGITVFDSTGLAVQDMAVARAVYDRAVEEGVGRALPLVTE